MSKSVITIAAVMAMGIAMAASSTYTWVGAQSGGDWQDSENWNPKKVPEANSTAIITGTTTINISCVSNQVKNLTVKLDTDCKLQIDSGVTVNLRELRVGSSRVANGTWDKNSIRPVNTITGDGKVKINAGGMRIVCRQYDE